MTSDLHLRAKRASTYRQTIELDLYGFDGKGNVSICKYATMETMSEEDANNKMNPPFLTITPPMAQELMDDLWQCGIRPSEGSGSAGSLAATERHLHDMRAMVFRDDVKAKP